ncbi:MAG TPA: hypothetical protein PKD55_14950, partial [Bellilinea sp.]|nr:hypothetical protein [Bellilinea sp.]
TALASLIHAVYTKYPTPSTTGNINYVSGLTIGSTSNSIYPLSAPIDDVRIYNYALSPAQILKVYNQGQAVNFTRAN